MFFYYLKNIRFILFFVIFSLSILSASPLQVLKGGVITDGLQVSNIRMGVHKTFTRIVFDVDFLKQNENTFKQKPSNVGYYTIILENNSILVELSGFRMGTNNIAMQKHSHIDTMTLIRDEAYADDSSIFYLIKLSKKVYSFKAFSLTNPPRLVLDVIYAN